MIKNIYDYIIKMDNTENTNEESIILKLLFLIIGTTIGMIIGYYIFRDIKYIGPDSNKIVKKTYKDKDGKFRFRPQITICPTNYSMNKLHNKTFRAKH